MIDEAVRPFRIVNRNGKVIASGYFQNKESAENLMRGMNDLKENWTLKNGAPYRVQELTWKDV